MVVYTLEQHWEIMPAIDLQKMSILAKKKSSLQMKLMLHVGGYINKQNCRIWSTENPHAYIRCLVRILVQRQIGPFFFENELKEAVTVNGDRYRAMLNEFLFTKIEEEDIGNIWFQQDGAKCHTAKAILDVLRPVFEDRFISRRADVVWPPRSCDLTPLDYYLWGVVKDKCYADKPETSDALKDNIHEAIG